MPFTFGILDPSNYGDPNGIFADDTGTDGNVGDTFTILDYDYTKATTEGFPDDGGSDLTEPVTINGTTYQAGDELEANYEVIFIDQATGLYHRVTAIQIDNSDEPVGIVISPGWDITTGEFVPNSLPDPGTTLTAIDGDDLDGTPNIGQFATDNNYVGIEGNDAELNDSNGVPICFGSDVAIFTSTGSKPAGEICVGDRVHTLDHGFQPVQWVGRITLESEELTRKPQHRPIRIKEGALGHGLPMRDMLLSPQHRVMVSSVIAERMFGATEVLVAAKHLLSLPGVEVATDVTQITYVHFLCRGHEILMAEGCLAETLFWGSEAQKSLSSAAQTEIMSLMQPPTEPARTIARGRRGKRLAERHAQNEHHALAKA
ncbi:hypothetical protein PARPLA_01914 [Rhodobacteraceae bacterium THAF1]|uniref:Hint domain-containing protein n=1 Tax=Palleronia sp. THAF1 TaxID=2587842 RepID=UPI000F41235B|nr:Hint domain-containing protein [Palleronia sp. THAF1]QFU08951.1 hypothetical protein FIU81_09730 [Palleronia sp. THAF1]VDC24314.1 hypothetical protein PARPLA_01914 [Rhodobacteraceae bacterium THAF1]